MSTIKAGQACQYMRRREGSWQFCGDPATTRITVTTICGPRFIYACQPCKAESDHARAEAKAVRS